MAEPPEHLRKQLREYDGPLFPAPPPSGGYLVLTPSQMANADLVATIKFVYPQTKIIESKPIPLSRD